MASGDSFASMAYSYRMGACTVSSIIESVCGAIWNHLQPLFLKEPTETEWKQIAKDFKDIWQFDHCVGAIDGKHVVIKAPPKSGTNFFNYKKTFSIVLLAVVDANKRFIYIDVGSMGRYSDGGILSDSVFGQKLRTSNLNLPPMDVLYPGGPELPFVFIGDEAFPLMNNLMRAYPKSQLTDSRRIYNYRLSRARQVVEHAFGILSARWRVYKRPFECRIELVDKIVNATCALHNYLITNNKIPGSETSSLINNNQLTKLTSSGFRYSNESFFIREEFCRFFNTAGSVPWQSTRIENKLLRNSFNKNI